MQGLSLYLRKPRRIVLTAALFVLASLSFENAYALRCSFTPANEGFLYDRQTLPANAQGAVFTAIEGLTVYTRQAAPSIAMLTHPVRPSLSSRDFEALDRSTGRKLEVTLTRLEIRRQIGLPPIKYLGIEDEPLRHCALENRFSLDGCMELDESLPRLIEQKKLQDVTQAVEAAYGNFLIAPKTGFEPLKSYSIRYVGPLKDEEHVKYRRNIYVDVDDRPLPPLANGDVQIKRWKNKIRYALPESYSAYLDNLHIHSFVRRESDGDVVPQELKLIGLRGPCSAYPTRGEELKLGEYLPLANQGCYQAYGYVGFLELNGRMQQSDSVRSECAPSPVGVDPFDPRGQPHIF